MQNKADGKLVAAEGGFTSEDSACGGEKLDSAQLEFTYILTQQLDSQRMFYEEKMNKLVGDIINIISLFAYYLRYLVTYRQNLQTFKKRAYSL